MHFILWNIVNLEKCNDLQVKDTESLEINNAGSVMQVTDYSRDLKEMQNVSREDYLASLRR